MMGALGVAHAGAQSTPPRPAVSVRQQPPFSLHVRRGPERRWPPRSRRRDLRAGSADRVRGRGWNFGPSRSLNRQGTPLAVGDFNGDRHPDLVVASNASLSILPGRGDGAFGAPRIVGPWVSERIVVADFNGDGKLDFALIDLSVVCVYPGRGDFTFDARVELAAPSSRVH